MCCLPSKGVFFPCFGDAGGQIYNIYLDNNLNDYLMLDLRCLGTGNDLLLFSTSCPARRRPAWQLGRCGAGEGSEPENRSVLLLSAAYFYVYVYYNLVDALRFYVLIRCVLLFFVPVAYSSFKKSVQHWALLRTSHIAVKGAALRRGQCSFSFSSEMQYFWP